MLREIVNQQPKTESHHKNIYHRWTQVLLTGKALQAVSLLSDSLPSLTPQRLQLFRQQDVQLQLQGINLNDL